MKASLTTGIAVLILLVSSQPVAAADRQDLLAAVGIPPANGMRGQMDTVGFVTTAAQMDSVLAQCRALAGPRRDELDARYQWSADTAFAAAVCPHDDFYYAGRLYELVVPRVQAPTVIVCGVFHKARVFDCRDQLVFDSFETWRGPYGPVKVSALRDELIARLPAGDLMVDDDMHTVEHSIEAIVPWLQAYRPDVEIVPILVPSMGWDTMDRLADEFAAALTAIMRERGWVLGRDVAVIASADAVHYGDAGWGGSVYADFGVDAAGYTRAVERDRLLAETTLAGTVGRPALKEFLDTCVESADPTRYRLTWCGRFSIPFGLDVASRVSEALAGRPLAGTVLDYGTSLEEINLDLDAIPGLGVTAPNNLHHWVGYVAVGYR